MLQLATSHDLVNHIIQLLHNIFVCLVCFYLSIRLSRSFSFFYDCFAFISLAIVYSSIVCSNFNLHVFKSKIFVKCYWCCLCIMSMWLCVCVCLYMCKCARNATLFSQFSWYILFLNNNECMICIFYCCVFDVCLACFDKLFHSIEHCKSNEWCAHTLFVCVCVCVSFNSLFHYWHFSIVHLPDSVLRWTVLACNITRMHSHWIQTIPNKQQFLCYRTNLQLSSVQ